MRSPYGLAEWLRAADLATAQGRADALALVLRETLAERIPSEVAGELRKLICAYAEEHLAGGSAAPVEIVRAWSPDELEDGSEPLSAPDALSDMVVS